MRTTKHAAVVVLLCLLLTGNGAAAENVQAAVPFVFFRHEVVVEATVNGQGPYPMLLDSGTNPSVIDVALARKLGLSLTPAGRVGSGGGTEKPLMYETSLPSVGVGGEQVANVDCLAEDLSGLSRRFGHPLRGVLGHSFLMGHVVQFDYPAHIVRFLSVLPPPGPRTLAAFPFHGEEGVQMNGVRVNGRPVRANIDTGSSSAFQFTPEAVRALGLTAQARHARAASGAGFNGAFTARVGTVGRVTFGKIAVTRPAVTFWMPGTGHDTPRWDVNVGNAFLSRYVLTLDYARKRLTLDTPAPVTR